MTKADHIERMILRFRHLLRQARAASPATPASRARGFANGCSASARKSTAGAAGAEAVAFLRAGTGATDEAPILDIRDAAALEHAIDELRPDFIFHLAAQALVRVSYREPVPTFATNTLGTAHLLEAVRAANFPCTIVVVTTDKCYENDGRARAALQGKRSARRPRSLQREQGGGGNRRGGVPRFVFFAGHRCRARLRARGQRHRRRRLGRGPARARLRSAPCPTGKPIPVRNPDFTRPWQHVLEPLGGYLLLGAKLEQARQKKSAEEIARFAQAFNFGPEPDANRTRARTGRGNPAPLARHVGTDRAGKTSPEAPLLSLAIDKAKEDARLATALGFCADGRRKPWRGIAKAGDEPRRDDRFDPSANQRSICQNYELSRLRKSRGFHFGQHILVAYFLVVFPTYSSASALSDGL